MPWRVRRRWRCRHAAGWREALTGRRVGGPVARGLTKPPASELWPASTSTRYQAHPAGYAQPLKRTLSQGRISFLLLSAGLRRRLPILPPTDVGGYEVSRTTA